MSVLDLKLVESIKVLQQVSDEVLTLVDSYIPRTLILYHSARVQYLMGDVFVSHQKAFELIKFTSKVHLKCYNNVTKSEEHFGMKELKLCQSGEEKEILKWDLGTFFIDEVED